MQAFEVYRRVFGEIKTLAEGVSWSTGISNLFEWCVWETSSFLGISKTQYVEKVMQWGDEVSQLPLEQRKKYVLQKIKEETSQHDTAEPYQPPKKGIVSPTEALRRARFFSENYLNKEFDIFWGLVSDAYLDSFYGRFFSLTRGGRWFCHGNSGLFANSTRITDMQMDNLSYNPDNAVLVANELKLGGRKNPDQILKYALMQKQLIERGFIKPETRLVLCFIGQAAEPQNWDELIEAERLYCQNSTKDTAKRALACAELARDITFVSTAWSDILQFNEAYISLLDATTQQVEVRLLAGFNESLRQKAFLNL